jgi:hypothetical protein
MEASAITSREHSEEAMDQTKPLDSKFTQRYLNTSEQVSGNEEYCQLEKGLIVGSDPQAIDSPKHTYSFLPFEPTDEEVFAEPKPETDIEGRGDTNRNYEAEDQPLRKRTNSKVHITETAEEAEEGNGRKGCKPVARTNSKDLLPYPTEESQAEQKPAEQNMRLNHRISSDPNKLKPLSARSHQEATSLLSYPSSTDVPANVNSAVDELNDQPAETSQSLLNECDMLNIRKMLPYKVVYSRPVRGNTELVAIFLGFLLMMQFFLVLRDSFMSYNTKSNHSGCECTFPFPWLLTFALRAYSRIVIPLAVSIMFWRQVVRPWAPQREGRDGQQERSPEEAFSFQLMKKNNASIVKAFIAIFWNSSLVNSTVEKQLQSVQDHFERKLIWMLLLAIIQPIILFVALVGFNVFNLTGTDNMPTLAFMLGIADIISLTLVSFASGIMLSFYFIEVDIKKYIRCLCTVQGIGKTLISKATRIDNCITDRWYPLEIGMRISSGVYPILLLVSWSADTPLSCGFSVPTDTLDVKNYAAACWLVFILSIAVGQLLSSAPLKPDLLGPVGLLSEFVILLLLWIFSPTHRWSELTHILYAVVPLCFLLWYHVVSIDRQLAALRKGKNKPTHVSRLCSRISLLLLITVGLYASVATDYGHLHPSAQGKYSMIWHFQHGISTTTADFHLRKYCYMYPEDCIVSLK